MNGISPIWVPRHDSKVYSRCHDTEYIQYIGKAYIQLRNSTYSVHTAYIQLRYRYNELRYNTQNYSLPLCVVETEDLHHGHREVLVRGQGRVAKGPACLRPPVLQVLVQIQSRPVPVLFKVNWLYTFEPLDSRGRLSMKTNCYFYHSWKTQPI